MSRLNLRRNAFAAAVYAFMYVAVSMSGCQAAEDVRLFLSEGLQPPAVLGVEIVSPTRIEIHCDSPVAHAVLRTEPEISVVESGVQENIAWFELARATQIGRRYALFAVLHSPNGHSAQVMRWGFGYNPRPAQLIFNEVIVRGSGNNPDCIELLVIEGGNLGGSAWFLGTAEVFDAAYYFPAIEVTSGDYITLHTQPEGILEEVDELEENLDLSRGKLSHPQARDLWTEVPVGLPGNNGVLSLYTNPAGGLQDSLAYSNRTSESDETYHGFGTAKMLAWIESLAAIEGWAFSTKPPLPEECVDPEGSTGTRSLNRSSPTPNTCSPTDWHIVPTRGATIGEDNSDERYVP